MEKENIIGARFREVRAQLGLTQLQLAERLLITRNYLAKIETGAKEPSTRVVKTLESLRVDQGHKTDHSEWPRGDVGNLRSEIHGIVDRTLAAAGASPARLHWMVEQLRTHLAVPQHWTETARPMDARIAEMRAKASRLPAGSSERNVLTQAAQLLEDGERAIAAKQAAARPAAQERSA